MVFQRLQLAARLCRVHLVFQGLQLDNLTNLVHTYLLASMNVTAQAASAEGNAPES